MCAVVDGVVSPADTAALRAWLERCGGWEPAAITVRKGKEGIDPDVRNSLRAIWFDSSLHEDLWRRLAPFVPGQIRGGQATGLNERLSFLKYEPGHFFAPHEDSSYQREDGSGERSYLTVLLYLTDPRSCAGEGSGGGCTRFICPKCQQVARTGRCDGDCEQCVDAPVGEGSILVFAHELTHAGTLMRSGGKVVMRTDVMYTAPTLAARAECRRRGK